MNNILPLYVKNLSITHGRHKIFENVDLTLKAKEFVTIMGENGSGKTTLINSLLGQKQPRSGSIKFWNVENYHDDM